MLPSAYGLRQYFQDLGHSFSPYGPPSRQITYIYFHTINFSWLPPPFKSKMVAIIFLKKLLRTRSPKLRLPCRLGFQALRVSFLSMLVFLHGFKLKHIPDNSHFWLDLIL